MLDTLLTTTTAMRHGAWPRDAPEEIATLGSILNNISRGDGSNSSGSGGGGPGGWQGQLNV